ncbi:hypothetical protein DYI37_00525 [Fulvimarina endophytica]|uniref:SWIM-type domain-containing protein n=1 Tax=Fulvimarina endophytica TaxID=2293836 RepID=A0A371XAE0_9HYPH|nr:hypothetical protein [Fulvimarina endophytica]RFC66004.1 hypothetical protein DYI37_00525 [Fulvimarina endophytica]
MSAGPSPTHAADAPATGLTTPASAVRRAAATLDDTILEAAASRGLVRRAARDAASGKSEITGEDEAAVSLRVDGETVVLTPAGLKGATCTCPATSVCRHVLTAIITLRDGEASGETSAKDEASKESVAEETPGPSAATPPFQCTPADEAEMAPTDAPRPGDPDVPPGRTSAPEGGGAIAGEIAAVSSSEMTRAFGRAALRDAEALLADLSSADETVSAELTATKAVIHIPGHPPVHFVRGGGAAGMITKGAPNSAEVKTRFAAALLGARRVLAGEALAIQPSGDTKPTDSRRQGDDARRSGQTAFLAEVRSTLEDCARQALATGPEALQDRLFDLALSSRADALPRLSRLLLEIAGTIERRRDHAPGYEPLAALRTIAEAAALTVALGARPDDPVLRGATRTEPIPLGPVTLLGCGLEIWRMPSGSRGVTAHFRQIVTRVAGSEAPLEDGAGDLAQTGARPRLRRMLTATLARPAGQDPSFDPTRAAKESPVFGHSLERLAGSTFNLSDAAVGPEGRLSLGKAARATILEESWTAAACGAAGGVAETAMGEGPDRAGEGPLTFAEWQNRLTMEAFADDPHAGTELIALSGFAAPFFDPLEQTAILPARDADGTWSELALEGSGERIAAILARIEAIGDMGAPIVLAVLPRRTGDRIRLRPLAYAVLPGAPPTKPKGVLSALAGSLRGQWSARQGAIGAPAPEAESQAGRLVILDLLPDLPWHWADDGARSPLHPVRRGKGADEVSGAAEERAAAMRFVPAGRVASLSDRLVAAALDDGLALSELGGKMRDTARLARMRQTARRLADTGLAPLGTALDALAGASDAARANALLRFVHLATLYQTLDPRVPLLQERRDGAPRV